LRPGEALLLYTAGLTNARHPHGDRVGEAQLAAWLRDRAVPGDASLLSPAELAADLLRLTCPEGLAALEDAAALLALRRTAPSPRGASPSNA
jgi:Stage II sporulation protein E (SpoIIE)